MNRVEDAAERSPLVRAALEMAREAHAGQIRNASGGRPYIDHPVAVAENVSEHVTGDEVLAAALLHDVVEDSDLGFEEIRARCGERVAEIVGVLTDDESLEPYEERKREHRRRVADAGHEEKAIYAADKLTNVSMLRDAYREEGEAAIASELKVPLDEKLAVWEQDLEMLRADPDQNPAVRALSARLEEELSGLAEERRQARAETG